MNRNQMKKMVAMMLAVLCMLPHTLLEAKATNKNHINTYYTSVSIRDINLSKRSSSSSDLRVDLRLYEYGSDNLFITLNVTDPSGRSLDSTQKFERNGYYDYYAYWTMPSKIESGYYEFEVIVEDLDSGERPVTKVERFRLTDLGTSTGDGSIDTLKLDYNEKSALLYLEMNVYTSSDTRFDHGEFRVVGPDKKSVSTSRIEYTNRDKTKATVDTDGLEYGTYTVYAETYAYNSGSYMSSKSDTVKIGNSKPTITDMKAINDSNSKTDYDINDAIRISAKVSGDAVYRVDYEFRVAGKRVDSGETKGRVSEPYVVWDTDRLGNIRYGDKVEVRFILLDSNKKELDYKDLSLSFASGNVLISLRDMPLQYQNQTMNITILADITGDSFTETRFKLVNESQGKEIATGSNFQVLDSTSAFPKAEIRLPFTGEKVQGLYTITATVYNNNKEVATDSKTFTILEAKTPDDVPKDRGPGVHIIANGKIVNFTDQKPVIINERTLVPVRGVFEQLGFFIDWSETASTAVLEHGNNIVSITAGASTMIVNGRSVSLEVPAQIINSRMMLPLRAISEAVGSDVIWHEVYGTAVINYNR